MQGDLTLPQTGPGALNDGVGTEFDNPVNVFAPAQVQSFSLGFGQHE